MAKAEGVKERPILFNDQMVRAILDGRKSQTRRVVKPQPETRGEGENAEWWTGFMGWQRVEDCLIRPLLKSHRCPYGRPGDRLWVRESGWERPERSPQDLRKGADTWPPYCYDVDGGNSDELRSWGWKRRSSIHMPRWASRLTLEVTGVRVERLQEITTGGYLHKSDVQKEGCPFEADPAQLGTDEAAWFAELWDSINGRKEGCSWSDSPWVWAIDFRVLSQGKGR